MIADFATSRRVFHLKTDAHEVRRLRHDVVVQNGLIRRYSLIANPDFAMGTEEEVVNLAIHAAVRAVPLLTKQDNYTYHVMRRARGVSVAELPIDLKRVAWSDLAVELRKLHVVKGTGAGLVVDGKPLKGAWDAWNSNDGYLWSAHLNVHILYCEEVGLITRETKEQILATLREKQITEPAHLSLLHGDLNDHNVFADPTTGHLTDIIDWEDALVGDPVFELAGWACFTSHPEEEWEGFIWHYYCETQLPQDFDRRFWLYYLRISLSRAVQLHRYGFTDLTLAKSRITTALSRLAAL